MAGTDFSESSVRLTFSESASSPPRLNREIPVAVGGVKWPKTYFDLNPVRKYLQSKFGPWIRNDIELTHRMTGTDFSESPVWRPPIL